MLNLVFFQTLLSFHFELNSNFDSVVSSSVVCWEHIEHYYYIAWRTQIKQSGAIVIASPSSARALARLIKFREALNGIIMVALLCDPHATRPWTKALNNLTLYTLSLSLSVRRAQLSAHKMYVCTRLFELRAALRGLIEFKSRMHQPRNAFHPRLSISNTQMGERSNFETLVAPQWICNNSKPTIRSTSTKPVKKTWIVKLGFMFELRLFMSREMLLKICHRSNNKIW